MQAVFVKGASRGKRANFEAVSPIRKSDSEERTAAGKLVGKRARHAQPLRVLESNEVSVARTKNNNIKRAVQQTG